MKCPCPSCIFSDLLAYGAGGVCCRNTDRARWSMMISDSVWARGISAPCPRCGAGKHTSYKQSSNDLALPAIRCRRILPRWPDVHPIAMVNIPSICANDHTEQCMIYHNYIDSLNTSQLHSIVRQMLYVPRVSQRSWSIASSFVFISMDSYKVRELQHMNLKRFVITCLYSIHFYTKYLPDILIMS